MEEILDSIKPVVQRAKFVRINIDLINNFVESVTKEEVGDSEIKYGISKEQNLSEEEYIAYAFVLASLQFCFWGDPKWTIEINNKKYDGSEGLVNSLKIAIDSNSKILDPKYLSELSYENLSSILYGNPEIPLLKERLEILNSLGEITQREFGGLFSNIVKKSNNEASEIVKTLISKYPKVFDDSVDYHGDRVQLQKRVQLVPMYLSDLHHKGLSTYNITGMEKLTGLADYKVPQMLRKIGILEYNSELSNMVDNKVEIIAGSDEEIEIRAFTIYSGELARKLLINRFPEISGARVHKILWSRSQTKYADDKPYHRTRTIWY